MQGKCKLYKSSKPYAVKHQHTLKNIFHFLLGRTYKTVTVIMYQLYVPKPNLEIFRHTLVFSCSSIWNYLTYNIQHSTSIQHFERQYVRWTGPSFVIE